MNTEATENTEQALTRRGGDTEVNALSFGRVWRPSTPRHRPPPPPYGRHPGQSENHRYKRHWITSRLYLRFSDCLTREARGGGRDPEFRILRSPCLRVSALILFRVLRLPPSSPTGCHPAVRGFDTESHVSVPNPFGRRW
jgi:hypothetical protein